MLASLILGTFCIIPGPEYRPYVDAATLQWSFTASTRGSGTRTTFWVMIILMDFVLHMYDLPGYVYEASHE